MIARKLTLAAALLAASTLTGYAQKPSETASPAVVNGGMFTITDTSETTNPISVNGN